jgi:dTDP-4-amino-4,6-dideoxygalactose transaminase
LTFHATAFAALEAGLDVSVMPATKPEAACLVDIPYATPTIPVDLYGTPTDWLTKTIYPLLVDGCQSLGAEVQGKHVGDTAVWAYAISMYPGKNLGSMGEGGALLTSDGHLAEYARAYINQGQLRKGKHDILGTNGRMHALQAIPIYWGLQHLEEWNAKRRHVALQYDAVVDEVSDIVRIARRLQIPSDRLPTRHIYPIFAIQTRALIADALKAAGVPCAWHYPEQLSDSECFRAEADVDFGASAHYVGQPFRSEISLPCHPFITDSDVQVVREALLGVATRVAGSC